MHRLILFLAAFLGTSAYADLADDVRCRETAFSKSIENKDIDSFASFLDEDARFVGLKVRRGVAEIVEGWAGYAQDGAPTLKWRPQIVEVLKNGKLALSRGPYLLVATDADGVENEHWGTFNSVWRLKESGEWKVVFDAGSPASEPPADEVKALLDQEDDCDGQAR